MKSFWLSLIVFILLLCSCKTKEVVRNVESYEQFKSDLSLLNESIRQDTTNTKKIVQTEEFTRIYESEIIIEYDTDKGTPSKVTKKEKISESGSQAKTDESESRGIAESERNETDVDIDSESETKTKETIKEESVTAPLFKWLGIGISVIILLLIIWFAVKKKLHLW